MAYTITTADPVVVFLIRNLRDNQGGKSVGTLGLVLCFLQNIWIWARSALM